MPKYSVFVPEVHISERKVEANSPAEALEKVLEGEGEEVGMSFSYTHTGDDPWKVEDEHGNEVDPYDEGDSDDDEDEDEEA